MIALIALAMLGPASAFRCPAGSEVAQVVPGGITILPNGRLLTPSGERLYTGEDLWKVLRSPDGALVIGVHDGGFTVFDLAHGGKRTVAVREIAPAAAFTADGRSLILSEGDDGEAAVYSVPSFEKQSSIALNGGGIKDSYVNDIVVRGGLAYCVDVANQNLLTIDLTAPEAG